MDCLRIRRPGLVIASVAVTVGIVLFGCLVAPEVTQAALRSAAGGGGSAGGFARLVRFIDRVAEYAIPVGAALSVLGFCWGGMLFMSGDTRAGRVLGCVAIGLGVVLLSKPIAA